MKREGIRCPFCRELIDARAVICPHCHQAIPRKRRRISRFIWKLFLFLILGFALYYALIYFGIIRP